jgi:hypothetical protein
MDDQTYLQDLLINTALEERPLAPLPIGFVDRITAQMQATQAQVARETIRYKLEFLDIALPFLSLCLVVVALALAGQLTALGITSPVDWTAVLPADWTAPGWLDLVGLLLLAEICIGAMFCVWIWLDRPLPLVNGEA